MYKKDVVIVVLATLCLTVTLFSIIPVLSIKPYDPWKDVNDDGVIDAKDFQLLKNAIPAIGNSLTKAYLAFDSGWVNITDKCGRYFNLTHNSNSSDAIVDISGKAALNDGVHQRHIGLTDYRQGWSTTNGATGEDAGYSVIQSSDGGYVVTGYTPVAFKGFECYLVKADSRGNWQWYRNFGGSSNDAAYSVIQTSDGGYALAGETESFGAGKSDFYLVKTYADGNYQWSNQFGGAEDDKAAVVVQTDDGGYILAGSTKSWGSGDYDFYLVKTYPNGTQQWSKQYGGPLEDRVSSLVKTSDGGYAMAGYTYSFARGNHTLDAWLVKVDSFGDHEWNRTYGRAGYNEAHSLVQTTDGGYAFAGDQSPSANSYDFWLVKTDSLGNVQWEQEHGGAGWQRPYSLVQTPDGGYGMAGYASSIGLQFDYWLVKTDCFGNMQWNRTYGGSGDEIAFSLVHTMDDAFVIAGYTYSYGAGGRDLWLVKTDAESRLAMEDSTADTIELYRGATDADWNSLRIRLWLPK